MIEELNDVEKAKSLHLAYEKLTKEISQVIIGQEEAIQLLLTAIFCQGHCLLVGVPGLAKTLLINTIASSLDLKFKRIQFTPDLMPSDILGSETLDQNRQFQFIKGPIFSNIILADEINRTPPKTQAALLEAMQEYSVTVAGQHHNLEKPFFVLATQNPIEQEGTYPLPEAQLDRFMFNLRIKYPSYQSEVDIVRNTTGAEKKTAKPILSASEIIAYQNLVRKVPVADNVIEYAVKLVHLTRPAEPMAADIAKKYLEWGAGPRASQNLIMAAKCHALLNGKYSPDIEDVQQIAIPVLRHRLIKNFKAEAEGVEIETIINTLMSL
ncbi:MAG TPA: MoxR family ATPase [Cytophagaceae bacterium]|jgi:MoxR-like ATPase|nr:MoxR family ATPase [Cytophagaceae bacterium]